MIQQYKPLTIHKLRLPKPKRNAYRIQFGLNNVYKTGCSNNANTNLEVGGNTLKTKKYKGSK